MIAELSLTTRGRTAALSATEASSASCANANQPLLYGLFASLSLLRAVPSCTRTAADDAATAWPMRNRSASKQESVTSNLKNHPKQYARRESSRREATFYLGYAEGTHCIMGRQTTIVPMT